MIDRSKVCKDKEYCVHGRISFSTHSSLLKFLTCDINYVSFGLHLIFVKDGLSSGFKSSCLFLRIAAKQDSSRE